MFERQGRHLLALALLTAAVAWTTKDPRVTAGSLGGLSTTAWLWIAIATAVAHQVYVWLAWRLQLDGERLTGALGAAAFPLYCVGFTLLFAGRFVTLVVLAWSNRGSLAAWQPALRFIALLVSLPALYTFYSVVRYFGIRRAFGEDHFDEDVRRRGLVRRGIFRVTGNAMYTFGLLAVWLPGLIWSSAAGLIAALFTHLYIWVHYHCTELPDIRRIYGSEAAD